MLVQFDKKIHIMLWAYKIHCKYVSVYVNKKYKTFTVLATHYLTRLFYVYRLYKY